MKFSILLSLYHKENPNNLNDCFESIWVKQNIKPVEIVLVLDGPVGSDLIKVIDDWKLILNNVLKIIVININVGLGKALNEGLKHCSYDWVFRMDTDDICQPDRFEKQINFIKKNPDIVVLGGQILEFDSEPKEAKVLKNVPTTYFEIKKFAEKRCPFNHMTVAYRKDVIQKLGAYQHHLFMEDYNLWLRVLGKGYKVANLPDVLVYARVGNGMHARRKGFQYIKSEIQLLNLKKELKLYSSLHANMLFLLRCSVRLLPSQLLGGIYNTFLRKKVSNKSGLHK